MGRGADEPDRHRQPPPPWCTGGEIRYNFGGWAAPLGIEWVADAVSSLVMVVVSLIAWSAWSTAARCGSRPRPVGPGCTTFDPDLLSGLTGVVFAGDLFNVFVFLEVTTLTTCALIALADGKALMFAFRYLILATIGATFYLLGVTFVYGATGTLNMADLATRLPAAAGSHEINVGLAFIFLGLAIKMALMPFHGWLPDAYTSAQTPSRRCCPRWSPRCRCWRGSALCTGSPVRVRTPNWPRRCASAG